MSNEVTSFFIAFPMGEIVSWGKNEFDSDDFYPNPYLQLMANHLTISFPICSLYQAYFDGPLKGGRDFHTFKSIEHGSSSLIYLDLHIYDETDQHDMVYLGVKCQDKYISRVRKCLKDFLDNTQANPAVEPYEESDNIEFLEQLIAKYKT